MKKLKIVGITLLLIVIIVGGFSAGILIPNHKNSHSSKKLNDAIRINLDDLQSKKINKETFGFNLNLHSGHFSLNDLTFRDEIDSIHPGTLRFPGGEISNYYHWRSGTIDSSIVEEENRLSVLMRNFKNEYAGKIDFNSFMEYCKLRTIKPVLVVNLYTGTIEETRKWAEFVKENHFKILGWELGNELYLPRYQDSIPNVQYYSSLAEQHCQAIKLVDSNFKVAVNSHPSDVKVEPGIAGRKNGWNAYLSKQKYFDCYSLHIYWRPLKMYNKTILNDADTTKKHLLLKEYTDKVLSKISNYETYYGNKPMWLTEWNIHDELKMYPNTTFHQLWYAYMCLWLTNRSLIETNHYNVLAGPNNGFPLLTRSLKSKARSYSPDYYFAKVFGNIIDNNSYQFSNQITTYESVEIMGYGKSENNVDELLVINYSNSSKTLRFDGKEIKAFKSYYLRGNQTYTQENSVLKPFSINILRFYEDPSDK